MGISELQKHMHVNFVERHLHTDSFVRVIEVYIQAKNHSTVYTVEINMCEKIVCGIMKLCTIHMKAAKKLDKNQRIINAVYALRLSCIKVIWKNIVLFTPVSGTTIAVIAANDFH